MKNEFLKTYFVYPQLTTTLQTLVIPWQLLWLCHVQLGYGRSNGPPSPLRKETVDSVAGTPVGLNAGVVTKTLPSVSKDIQQIIFVLQRKADRVKESLYESVPGTFCASIVKIWVWSYFPSAIALFL